ncbi:MAG: ABC transporter substrate-binding protein [Syntrophobacteraceae bacterium]
MSKSFLKSSVGFRIGAVAMAWLVAITMAHLYLNREHPTPNRVRMGYMPVVANLAAPLVDYVTRDNDLYFEAVKFGSFSEMGDAFRSGHIRAAFIIAPLALALFEQGVPLKVVYIGNRHESTFVMRNGVKCDSPLDIAGKTIAVPLRYSGHNLAIKRFMREHGLGRSEVKIVEIPPPEMPAALASSDIDGYFVGEPFACKSFQNGTGKRFLNVETIWPKFICNLLIVREDLIQSHPEWVQKLVDTAAGSGLWAAVNTEEAIKVVSRYWGQDPGFILYSFSNPPGRFRFDLYAPVSEELDELAQEMRREGMIKGNIDVRAMVEGRFAGAVPSDSANRFQQVFSTKPGSGSGSQAQAAKK